jgi:hypothetical protein
VTYLLTFPRISPLLLRFVVLPNVILSDEC